MPSLNYDQVTPLITHCALERLLEKNRTLLSSLLAGGDRSIFIWSCKISGTRTGPLDLPALSNGGQFALFISMISNYMNGIPKLTQMSQITHTDTADWTQKKRHFLSSSAGIGHFIPFIEVWMKVKRWRLVLFTTDDVPSFSILVLHRSSVLALDWQFDYFSFQF